MLVMSHVQVQISFVSQIIRNFIIPVKISNNYQASICWSWRRLKKSSRHALKNFSIPLQRNNFTSSETSWRPLRRQKNITLKTSWRRLEDMSWRRLEGMSWRRLENMSWRCLEDLLKVLWRQPKYLLAISVYLSRY